MLEGNQIVQKSLHSTFFDCVECDAIDPKCAFVALGHLVGFLEHFHLADVKVKNLKVPTGSVFALTYILLLRSCKLMGVFIIHPRLPSRWSSFTTAGPFVHGDYPGSLLLLAPPLPSRCRPPSRCHRLYSFPFRGLPPRDEEAFSSRLRHPCHRAVAIAPPERLAASVSRQRSVLAFTPNSESGLWT